MDMVEVDVKLFVTCRMCLDQPGLYQIIPQIKNLIKFCFDIDIEPFDGLPQLICKNCKLVLSEYHDTKHKYLQKQQNLKERCAKQVNAPPSPPLPEINSCDKTNENGEIPTAPTVPQTESKQVDDEWKKAYDKFYVCNICSKSYVKLILIKTHMKTHKKILNKHKKVFRYYCSVPLNKIDSKKNSTGCSNVILKKDKIIMDSRNTRYHSFYTRKDFGEQPETDVNENECAGVKRAGMFSDDPNDKSCKGKKRKSRRLYSNSSTQTTVLAENKADCDTSNNIGEPSTQNDSNDVVKTVCTNIGETSLNDPPKKAKTKANCKAIQSIVTMCLQRYSKKVQSEGDNSIKPAFSESSLKHKVLSLGRKVIHKQGFGCTGLLRYMEHKNLPITWQPTSYAIKDKGSNFVRIMTKIKSPEDSENDGLSWKDLHKISFCSEGVANYNLNDSNTNDNKKLIPTIKTEEEENVSLLPKFNEDQIVHVVNTDSAMNDINYTNKLLNKTPVANPKQIPKKNMAENQPISTTSDDTTMLQSFQASDEFEKTDVVDSSLCMPIITSTQSLSTTNDKEMQKDPVVEKPAPRIKVKPASELMSERALNNQDGSENIWAFDKSCISLPMPELQAEVNHSENLVLMVSDNSASDGKSSIDRTSLREDQDTKLEYVTLHTSELPNTRTKSPFQYFKTVLLHHGLILLELNEELPAYFSCLVKFTLLLKQDTKQSLGVLLSLFCSNDSFCFTFKDSNLRKFDPKQLPAFWQWELLKIYKGDVVNKILQNALKISKEVHDNTKKFLVLLKSIDCNIDS